MTLERVMQSCPRHGQRAVFAESEDMNEATETGRWIASDTLWEVRQ